ncbi:peptidoglycan-binding protein [Glycomyces sp. TRM65418]|uniref:peptidoglycan-binding protein n=1 Tax=Glycomyces sp. TRM65418 TaxID=2867006 RepID=UPI001CE65925|nr:peptidoglycan-binding protein [Glycomyces sp. TRM65418]MCC3763862.1 peptidoglycan-binding protein [Glycomyces sp. TRM65418]QZD53565.1 peptidoglycan-binding protein [Glycomyces sp. TRM65418]
MKPKRILLPSAAVVAAAAVAVAFTSYNGAATAENPESPPGATTEVQRRDLARSDEVDGTLSYGEADTLTGTLPGTITWMPDVGTVIEAGQALYDVDNRPVVLMDGTLPMWRPLVPGVEGPDVKQFEQNLADLGYDGFTVDDEYTDATADAVERWQDDLDAPETGTVAVGEVVFLPNPARIADHTVTVGSAANGPIMAYTGRDRHVTLELQVSDQDLAKEDQAVTVALPDGTEVAGTVTDVSSSITAAPTQEGQPAEEEEAAIEVTVAVDDPNAVGDLESAPVKVELVAEVHEDVLVVPVEALLALREGGYGLEVAESESTELIPVETGIFASGLVEVSGEGLEAGTQVVIPE